MVAKVAKVTKNVKNVKPILSGALRSAASRARTRGEDAKIKDSFRCMASPEERGRRVGASGIRTGENRCAVAAPGAACRGAIVGMAGRMRLRCGRADAGFEFRGRSIARGSHRAGMESRTAGSRAAISGDHQPVYHRGGSQNRIRRGASRKRRREPALRSAPSFP
jgi:hypothetical protein